MDEVLAHNMSGRCLFDMKLTRYKFRFCLGVLFAASGLFFTAAAIHEFVGSRPHGLLRFYEFLLTGPLLFLSGVGCCFDKKDA
jgi:hypothetical protein